MENSANYASSSASSKDSILTDDLEQGIEIDECAVLDKNDRPGTSKATAIIDHMIPGLRPTINNVGELTSQLNDLMPQINTALDSFTTAASGIQGAASSFEALTTTLNSILSRVPILNDYIKHIGQLLVWVYDVAYAWINKLYGLIPTLVARLLSILDLDTKLISLCISSFSRLLPPIESSEAVPSANPLMRMEGIRDVVARIPLFGAISEMIGILFLRQKPTQDQMRYVNEKCRYDNNLFNSVKDVYSIMVEIIRMMPNWLTAWLEYCMPARWYANLLAPGTPYFKWIDEVASLKHQEVIDKAAYDPATQEQVRRLYEQGSELLKIISASGPKMVGISRLLQVHFAVIDRLYNIVDVSALHRTWRPAPCCIYLAGKTGAGKSFIATILPSILAGCPQSTPNLSYARNASQGFWDGYTGQFAVLYDDFGASKTVTPPGEFAELIMEVSNTQMHLNFADLADKGHVFRSQVIICTSNQKYPHSTDILDAEAFYRRRSALYEVKIKDQYKLPGREDVDTTKIPNDCSHWEFYSLNPAKEHAPRGPAMNYNEFVVHVRDVYNRHKEAQIKSLDQSRQLAARAFDTAQAYNCAVEAMRENTTMVDQVQKKERESMLDTMRMTALMAKEGLLDDFQKCMLDMQRETGEARQKAVSAAHEIWKKLQEADMEEQAKAPKWMRVLMEFLPWMAVIAGFVAVVSLIRKNRSLKKQIMATASPAYKTSTFSIVKYAIPDTQSLPVSVDWKNLTVEQLAGLRSLIENKEGERITHLMSSEGRWEEAFTWIPNLPKDCVNLWEKAMESQFGMLSDDQVVEVIERVRHMYPQQKAMVKEGVYYGVKTPGQRKVKTHVVMKKEGSIDENAMDIVHSRIIPSLVRVKSRYMSLQAMTLGGRYILLPFHFFADLSGTPLSRDDLIQVTSADFEHEEFFDPRRLCRIAQDSAVYHLNISMRTFRSNWDLFPSSSDLDFHAQNEGVLVSLARKSFALTITQLPNGFKGNTEQRAYYADAYREQAGCDRIEEEGIDSFEHESLNFNSQDYIYEPYTSWYYTAQTYFGMCGAPLVVMNKYANKKIVGMHVSGMRGAGLAHPVTTEMLKIARDYFNLDSGILMAKQADSVIPAPASLLDQGRFTMDGNFTRLGYLPAPIYTSAKTRIRPSAIAGKLFPVKTAPAILDPHDNRKLNILSPLREGIQKYGNPAKALKPEIVEEVINHLSRQLNSVVKHTIQRRVWSEQEALNGLPAEHCEPINMDTSPGYPYNQKGTLVGVLRERGKRGLIGGCLTDRDLFVPEGTMLRNRIDQRWQAALVGERVESIWIDSLKDERRTIEKVIDGKTRVFTIPPLDFTIVSRRLFYAFSASFYNSKLKFFSAVGINPMSMEWTLLMRKLMNTSDIGFAGDYSGWDGNLSPQLLMGVCDIINRWYDDGLDFQMARRVIFEEIIHTTQLAFDCIYNTHIGNPSGNPLTVIINTIVGAMYLRYAYLIVAPPSHRSLSIFDQHITDIIYGDDMAAAVTREALQFFNPTTFATVMQTVNMKYTSARKDGPAEIEPVLKFTFLKNGFVNDGYGNFLPTMSITTITELLNWVRDSKWHTPQEALVDNCNCALGFMFSYGRDNFDRFYERLCSVLGDAEIIQLHTYEYYYANFYGMPSYTSIMAKQSDPVPQTTRSDTDDVRSLINTKGIISASQRETNISSPAENKETNGTRLQKDCITEPKWSLSDMVNRRVYLNSFNWTAAQGVHTVIVAYEVPTDIIVNYLQSAAFERFLYNKAPVKFHIQTNGMRQQSGRLMAYFVPKTKKAITNVWHSTNFATSFSMNPVFISPSTNPEAIVHCPYYNPKAYININGPYDAAMDFTGTFVLEVVRELRVADCAQTSINVSIWATFDEDTQFHIPIHSGATMRRAFNDEHARTVLMRKEGNTVTGGNTTVYGSVTGSTFPQTVKGDDFSGIASGNDVEAHLDRPAWTANPFPVYRKGVQNIANTIGPEVLQRLDLNPSNLALCTKDHFGTNYDEMLLSFLLHKPTWLASVEWISTAAPGTSIYRNWLGPMMSMFIAGTETQVAMIENQHMSMTLWEYNTMRFGKWRGGIRFRIDMVATQFHTGRLIFTANYGSVPSEETTLRDATSQFAYVMELSNEKQSFEFTVPYQAATPVLSVCRGVKSPDDVSSATAWYMNYFLGAFDIVVLNQLALPCATPPDVTLIISVCGAPDFEVYMPSASNLQLVGSVVSDEPIPRTTLMMKQSANASSDGSKAGEDAAATPVIQSADNVAVPVIAPPGTRDMPRSTLQFGHKAFVTDARMWMRRYVNEISSQPAASTTYLTYQAPEAVASSINDYSQGFTKAVAGGGTAPATPALYIAFSFLPVTPIRRGGNSTYATYNYAMNYPTAPLEHFGSQYRFWRGSMNYKIIWSELRNSDMDTLQITNRGAMFIPASTFSYMESPVPPRANFASMAIQFAASITPLETPYAAALAADLTVDLAPTNDIQTPFYSRFQVLETAQGRLTTGITPETEYSGMLFIFAVFPSSGVTADMGALEAGGVTLPFNVLKAAGDDFRFGTFLGTPNVYNTGTSAGPPVWPSTWVTSVTPPTRSDSDEDFVQIQPARRKTALMQKQGGYLGTGRIQPPTIIVQSDPNILTPEEVVRQFMENAEPNRIGSQPIALEKAKLDWHIPPETGNIHRMARALRLVITAAERHAQGAVLASSVLHLWRALPGVTIEATNAVRYERGRPSEPFIEVRCHIYDPIDKCDYLIDFLRHFPDHFSIHQGKWIVDYARFEENLIRRLMSIFVREYQVAYAVISCKSLIGVENAGTQEIDITDMDVQLFERSDPPASMITEIKPEKKITYLMQRQGEVLEQRVAPTTENILAVARDGQARHEKEPDLFNWRQVIHFITAKITTANYHVSTTQEGPGHLPTFLAHGVFKVDNPVFDELESEEVGTSKKSAEERAARGIARAILAKGETPKAEEQPPIKLEAAASVPVVTPGVNNSTREEYDTRSTQVKIPSGFGSAPAEHIIVRDVEPIKLLQRSFPEEYMKAVYAIRHEIMWPNDQLHAQYKSDSTKIQTNLLKMGFKMKISRAAHGDQEMGVMRFTVELHPETPDAIKNVSFVFHYYLFGREDVVLFRNNIVRTSLFRFLAGTSTGGFYNGYYRTENQGSVYESI